MRAVVVTAFGGPEQLVLREHPNPVPAAGEVVVAIRAAAFNRRDVRVVAGLWPGVAPPFVPGSDAAGVVRDIGPDVQGVAVGAEVVICPSLDWGDDPRAQGDAYRILGGPGDGTWAESVAVPAANCFPKPPHLSMAQAAALPLAGLTVYRALHTRARLRAGETVVVFGAGAGTTTLAIQLAVLAGARVFTTSSDPAKLDRARELGAAGGVDYRADGWVDALRREMGGPADVVVDSAGLLEEAIALTRRGGRIVNFGATAQPAGAGSFVLRSLYMGQIDLLGTLMGSPAEFAALLDLVATSGLVPVVDSVRPLAEAEAMVRRALAGQHFGKLVLEP